MKNRFLGLFLAAILSLTITGCGPLSKIFHKRNTDTEIVARGSQSMFMSTYEFNGRQLDSLFTADSLPKDFGDGWIRKAYTDYETRTYIIRYMYIKDLSEDYEMIYIVSQKQNSPDLFIVSKRKVVTEEE